MGKSVSDGKTLVAGAITAKGVETASDSTFQQMADNISNIKVGGTFEQVLLGSYKKGKTNIDLSEYVGIICTIGIGNWKANNFVEKNRTAYAFGMASQFGVAYYTTINCTDSYILIGSIQGQEYPNCNTFQDLSDQVNVTVYGVKC